MQNVILSIVIGEAEVRFAGTNERMANYIKENRDNLHEAARAWVGMLLDVDHVDINRVHTREQTCGCADASHVELARLSAVGDRVAQLKFLDEVLMSQERP